MITFRLTEDEYQRCCAHCHQAGINSISTLARTAITLLLQHSNRTTGRNLETRVSELEVQLQTLMHDAGGHENEAPMKNESISLETNHA